MQHLQGCSVLLYICPLSRLLSRKSTRVTQKWGSKVYAGVILEEGGEYFVSLGFANNTKSLVLISNSPERLLEQDVFFDVQVLHPSAPSNHSPEISSAYRKHKQAKK